MEWGNGMKRENGQPLKRGRHKGLVPVVVKIHGDPNKKQFTMYYSPNEWKALQDSKKEWCHCGNPVNGGMVPDNSCNCGVNKHHVHCLNCGKLVQVG
jgi:hypothetical protein